MSHRLHVLLPIALFGVFSAAAVIGPRWAAKDKMGIDAGIAAVGFFFVCAILAFIAGLYALIAAIRLRKKLSNGLFFAGMLPLPCLGIALTVLWLAARESTPQPSNPPPPTKPTTQPVDR